MSYKELTRRSKQTKEIKFRKAREIVSFLKEHQGMFYELEELNKIFTPDFISHALLELTETEGVVCCSLHDRKEIFFGVKKK